MPEKDKSAAIEDAASERLIVALDVPNAENALRIARLLRGHMGMLKVGLELFLAEGPALVRELASQQIGVFLDLKLHDIPNTVRGAAREAARLGVRMVSVHAAGGRRMMQAAMEGVREGAAGGREPLVLGITVLTSLANGDLAEIGWGGSAEAAVKRLARLAQESGLGGVVASPAEAAAIRQACGPGFVIVTPGIRQAAASRDDQARTATPRAAVRAGADFLVVGRPISEAPDPVAAADAVVEEIARGLGFSRAEASAHGDYRGS